MSDDGKRWVGTPARSWQRMSASFLFPWAGMALYLGAALGFCYMARYILILRRREDTSSLVGTVSGSSS